MTRLLNFTITQEKRREERGFLCLGMKEGDGLYSSGGGNIMEGHLTRVDKES